MPFEYKNNALHCGDLPLGEIAEKVGTPVYVYDFNDVAKQIEKLRQSFSGLATTIAFAVKANGNLSLLKFLNHLGCGFDIVSEGELFKVSSSGASTSKVVFSGVGKQRNEIIAAINAGIMMISVESAAELEVVETIAAELGKMAPVSLRINPEIKADTHPYLATGYKESKFGVDEKEGLELFKKISGSAHLNLVGMSCHIGTQILDQQFFNDLCSFVKRYYEEARAQDIHLRVLDLGGGMGIRFKDETPLDTEEYGRIAKKHFAELDIQLVLEPGRFIVGNAGVLLSRVIYNKDNGRKHFTIIDAAMNDLIRPALYQAYHHIIPVRRPENATTVKTDFVGPICESGDFLGKDREVGLLEQGELVAIQTVGAYGFSMAGNYNARCRPAEAAVRNGKWHLIREREQYEDLIRGELIANIS